MLLEKRMAENKLQICPFKVCVRVCYLTLCHDDEEQ